MDRHWWLMADLKLGATRVVATSSAVHASIPPVLHSVVAAPSESSGNLSPSLAHLSDHLLDHEAFLRSDWLMVEVGLQILVEAFTTLLRRPRLNSRRDADPVVCPVKVNQMHEVLVLGL